MKKTFREKVISKFSDIAKKHKLLKYPSLGCMTLILGVYYLGRHFATNGKRYGSVAFVILYFMNSCSFSFAVFSKQTGFVTAQETYNAIVEDSDVTLADEVAPDPEEQILLEKEDLTTEYDFDHSDMANTYTLDDILEHHENYQSQETEDGQEAEGGQAAQTPEAEEGYVFDSSDWRLVLVNKQHPIPEDYSFNLKTISGSMLCDERVIADLLAMMQAAKADGVNLELRSPYRSDGRQEWLFNRKIKLYMGQGLSYMEAYKESSQTVMVPGSSEHQIGLAFDIVCDTYAELEEGFADTDAGKWLAEHSCEYGFVLRYPLGKEYITSVEYEPWHFRYVGKEAACIMAEENICLEEFWDKYL